MHLTRLRERGLGEALRVSPNPPYLKTLTPFYGLSMECMT